MRDRGWGSACRSTTHRLAGAVVAAVLETACGSAPAPSLALPKPEHVGGLPVVTVSEVLRLAAADQASGSVLTVGGW